MFCTLLKFFGSTMKFHTINKTNNTVSRTQTLNQKKRAKEKKVALLATCNWSTYMIGARTTPYYLFRLLRWSSHSTRYVYFRCNTDTSTLLQRGQVAIVAPQNTSHMWHRHLKFVPTGEIFCPIWRAMSHYRVTSTLQTYIDQALSATFSMCNGMGRIKMIASHKRGKMK